MNALITKSIAIGFPIVALLACSSENLQTSGLEPSMNTNGQQPGSNVMPNPMQNDPTQNMNEPPPTGTTPTGNEGNTPNMVAPMLMG